jgi:hypothetical protein
MQLMDFVNDFCLILAKSDNKDCVEIFNSIRKLLDTITAQQSEELKVVE